SAINPFQVGIGATFFAVGGADADPRLEQVSPLGIKHRHFSKTIQNLSEQPVICSHTLFLSS
ncbi:MAG TPA: hypothetical protein PLB18_18380, partial [Acidobacteriota bacterium]|nr:hypothetical protein [Acidobacteriota bacterium]